MSLRAPIIVVGIAAVLLLVSPFGLGMLAESNVREELENMSEYPTFSFEVADYERGWASSQATIVVTPGSVYQEMMGGDPMMQAMLGQARVPFLVEVNHGPILTLNGFGIGSYAVKANLDPEEPWVAEAHAELGVSSLFELRGRSGLLGGFDFEGEISPVDVVDGGDTLAFSGLDFTGFTNGTDVTFDATAEQLAMQSMMLSFSLDGLALNGAYERRTDSIALGNAEFTLASVRASNPLLGASELFAIGELSASSETRLNDAGNIDTSISYGAGRLTADGIPSFTDVALGVNLLNIDGEALKAFADLYVQASADPTMLGLQALPILDRILATGPSISLDPIRFTMDGNSLDAVLTVTIDPSAMPTGSTMDFMNSSVAMSAIGANLEMTASKALVQELVSFGIEQQMAMQLQSMTVSEAEAMVQQTRDQMIALVVGQGMVIDEGDTYSTTVVFQNGAATVNGTPIPPEALGLF